MKLVNDTAVASTNSACVKEQLPSISMHGTKIYPNSCSCVQTMGIIRTKAHDIFPAVCYPDLFWRMADEDLNQPWHLFCPHEIQTVKGYCLEDFYGEEWNSVIRIALPILACRAAP